MATYSGKLKQRLVALFNRPRYYFQKKRFIHELRANLNQTNSHQFSRMEKISNHFDQSYTLKFLVTLLTICFLILLVEYTKVFLTPFISININSSSARILFSSVASSLTTLLAFFLRFYFST